MHRPTRTPTIIATILTGVLLATSAAARAEDDDEDPVVSPAGAPIAAPYGSAVVSPIATPDVAPRRDMEEHWYGWQVLAADAAGMIGTVSCISFADSEACVVPYFVAAPTVHLTHGRPMQALASVGVRLAFPIAGAVVGAAAANCSAQTDQFLCGLSEMGLGLLVGTVVASVFDMALLSTETRERPAATSSRLSFLSPSVSAGPNSASFGLRGSF